MLKEQKGITLVALVITIIVLLILAGVSISLVMGQNGVLTQATGAVLQQKIAGAKEKLDSSVAAMETAYMTEWAGNTSFSRINTYKGETTPGSDTYNADLVAFRTELEANGLKYVNWDGSAATDVATGTGLPVDIVAATEPTSPIEVYLQNGSDVFKVTGIWINSATGELTYDTFEAWNGSAFASK